MGFLNVEGVVAGYTLAISGLAALIGAAQKG